MNNSKHFKKVKLLINVDDLTFLIPEANKLKVLPRKKKKVLKKYVSEKILILLEQHILVN